MFGVIVSLFGFHEDGRFGATHCQFFQCEASAHCSEMCLSGGPTHWACAVGFVFHSFVLFPLETPRFCIPVVVLFSAHHGTILLPRDHCCGDVGSVGMFRFGSKRYVDPGRGMCAKSVVGCALTFLGAQHCAWKGRFRV